MLVKLDPGINQRSVLTIALSAQAVMSFRKACNACTATCPFDRATHTGESLIR